MRISVYIYKCMYICIKLFICMFFHLFTCVLRFYSFVYYSLFSCVGPAPSIALGWLVFQLMHSLLVAAQTRRSLGQTPF